MAEGFKLVVSADLTQAEKAIKDFVGEAEAGGKAAGSALAGGLNKSIPAIKNIPVAVKPAIKSISVLGDSLETLRAKLGANQEFLKVAKTNNEVIVLNANIRHLQQEIKRIETLGVPAIANVTTAVKKTGGAFNTIVSGANNAFGAIRKIAFILPGIGIAGIFGAIFSIFQSGAKEAEKEVDHLKETTDAAAEKQKELAQAFEKAAASVVGEAAKIADLRAILLSTTSATVQLTQATINQGLARLLFDQKNVALQNILNAAIQKELNLRKQNKPFSTVGNFRNNPEIVAIDAEIKRRTELGISVADLIKKKKELSNIKQLEFTGQDDLENINELSDGLEGFFKKFLDKDKAKGKVDDVIAQAKRLAAFLDNNTMFSVKFEVDETKSEKEQIQSAKDFLAKARSFIEKQTPEFRFKPLLRVDFKFINDGKFLNLIRDQAGIEATKTYKELKSEFEKNIKTLAESNPIVVSITAQIKAAIENEKEQAKFFKSAFGNFKLFDFPENPTGADGKPLFDEITFNAMKAGAAINQTLAPAFQNLFSAIKQGENPLKAFFNGIIQAVEQLIQKLIAAAVQALILSALIPGGGAGGFGSIFKNILGFAGGGIVSGPVLAMVGEGAGTNRSNPEVIAPLDQLRGLLAGLAPQQQGGGQLTARVRGNDLLLSNNRQNRTNRRNGAR